jgi:hypothetical protein
MNHEYLPQNTLPDIKQMAQRLFTATYYVWIAYMLPMVRPYMIAQTLLVVIPSALWISSIHVDYPNRLGLIWTAICLGKTSDIKSSVCLVLVPYKEADLFGALIIVFVFRNIKRYPPKMADKVAKWFEFFPGRLDFSCSISKADQ